jgi:hypothetical protein
MEALGHERLLRGHHDIARFNHRIDLLAVAEVEPFGRGFGDNGDDLRIHHMSLPR